MLLGASSKAPLFPLSTLPFIIAVAATTTTAGTTVPVSNVFGHPNVVNDTAVSMLQNPSPSLNVSLLLASNTSNALDNLTSPVTVGAFPEGQGRAMKWSMLVLTLVILCTAVGNLLVCLAVCWERRLQNMTNYFLMSLAIADFLVSLLVMPLGMIVEMFGYFPLNPEFCVLWVTSDVLMCTASIWHMCTMSMDRFFTLKYPMRYGRNKTRRMVAGKILFVWFISMAISSPLCIHGFIDISNVFNEGNCVIGIKNFIIYASIFAFYIPLLIMLVTYLLTLRILWKNQQRMQNIDRSDLKPRLAQLTAQCTGFAIPKLISNIKKSGAKNKSKKVNQSTRIKASGEEIKFSNPTPSQCVRSWNDSPSLATEPEMAQIGNVSASPCPAKMNYLAPPPTHYSCRSPSPDTSSYRYQSSESEESESDSNCDSYLNSSQSFRSLCANFSDKSQESWLNSSFKRKHRRKRHSAKEIHETQSNSISTGHRIRKVLHPNSSNTRDGNKNREISDEQRQLSSSHDLGKVKNHYKTSGATETLVKSLSCLSTPLHLRKESNELLISPYPQIDMDSFTTVSMPKLARKHHTPTKKTRKGKLPPPLLKIHHATDCATPTVNVEEAVHTNTEIQLPSDQDREEGSFPPKQRVLGSDSPTKNTFQSLRRRDDRVSNHQNRYYRRISPNRLSTGVTLVGAVSDSHVSQAGLQPHDEKLCSGFGTFPLSCGNLSKDYKSMEWDRRYFEIQEEMDQCLRGVFESKSKTEEKESTNSKKAEDGAMSHSASATPLYNATEQPMTLYSFYCRSMPSSPEKPQKKSESVIGINLLSSSSHEGSLNDGIDNKGIVTDSPPIIPCACKNESGLCDTTTGKCGIDDGNLFNFDEDSLNPINHDKNIFSLSVNEFHENEDKENFPTRRRCSDVIKICLVPPAVDDVRRSHETITSSISQASLKHDVPYEHGNGNPRNTDFIETSRIATPNTLSVTSAATESRNTADDIFKQDGLLSNTSSSLLDPNIVSEGDLTLDETDDTLDGNLSPDCLDDTDTASSKEKVPKLLFRKPAFRFKKNPSLKKQKSTKKRFGKNGSLRNTFRLKRISTVNQNGHTKNGVSNSVPNKHILSKKTASNEKKASKVLGIIFLVFVLLWTPFFILNILSVACPSCLTQISENAFSFCVWLGYVASLANPIIYTMFNTAFRRTFINILTCRMDRSRQSFLRRTPCPSYTTMIPSDRRNTVTLLLRDESR